MIRFFIALALATLLIAGSVWVLHELHWIAGFPSFFKPTLLFLSFGTGLMFRRLYRINMPDLFVRLYLLMMAVKILAFGTYIGFVVFRDNAGATSNVVFFMLCYFIFTSLEIVFLYQKTKADKSA